MGKRSSFKRVERDFYPTPRDAVLPLIPHLPVDMTYWEPCAGDGALIDTLDEFYPGCCWAASDIEPRRSDMGKMDAMESRECEVAGCDLIITNPPWNRKILHPMIEHFSAMRPTWLLFDASWAFTKQSAPFMPSCHRIVSVGRVKWFPESKMTGKDDCAWYMFDASYKTESVEFYGR